MNNEKYIIYYLLQVVYIALEIAVMFIFGHKYLEYNFYNNILFINLLVVIIVSNIVFGIYLGKIVSSLFICINIVLISICDNYISTNGLYPIIKNIENLSSISSYCDKNYVYITLLLCLVFLALTFVINKCFCIKKNYNKYRILCVLLLVFVALNNKSYSNKLKELNNSKEYFQKNETEYYVYYNDNGLEFKNIFGTYSYVYKTLNKPSTLRNSSEINNYIYSNNFSKNNTISAIFENKSILLIQVNNLNNLVIREEITPTLTYMKENGIYVEGFGGSYLAGAEGDVDFMVNTSIFPYTDEIIYNRYASNSYKTTLPMIYKSKGYFTEAYVNDYPIYFNRNVMFKNYGYDNLLDFNRLGYEKPITNNEMAEKMKWILSLSENLRFGYWPTDTDYCSVDERDVAIDNLKQTYKDLSDNLLRYLANDRCFDSSLNAIIEELNNQGKLNDYVFVVFGSGIDEYGEELLSEDIFEEGDKKESGLIIYSGDEKVKTYINKVSSYTDILPTLASMFNLEINRINVFGRDIFEEGNNGFNFDGEHTFYTDNYSYDFYSRELNVKNEYNRKNINQEIDNYLEMLKIMESAIKVNYFAE